MLILGIDVWYIVGACLAWFVGTLLAYRFIFVPIVLPWIEKCLANVIIRIFSAPTDVEKEALFGLLDTVMEYMGSRQLKTGKKIKTNVDTGDTDTDGNPLMDVVESDEILTPIELAGRKIGSYLTMKMLGAKGGAKAQINRILHDEVEVLGFRLSPAAMEGAAKGKFGPALLEIGLQAANKKDINKGNTFTNSGGQLR